MAIGNRSHFVNFSPPTEDKFYVDTSFLIKKLSDNYEIFS